MGKHLKSILVVLGIFVLVIFIVDKLLWNPPPSQQLTYSQFWTKVQARQVKQVTINGREIAVTHPGCIPLIQHERHTVGELELQSDDAIVHATCFTPGVA